MNFYYFYYTNCIFIIVLVDWYFFKCFFAKWFTDLCDASEVLASNPGKTNVSVG